MKNVRRASAMKKIYIILFVLTSLTLSLAQSNGHVSMGVSYQRWQSKSVDDPLQQIVAPINVFLQPSEGLYLNISNTPGSASFSDLKLSGMSDTWIRATYVLPNETVMLNLGVGAPTGKTELTASESYLSQMLSETAFQFRLPSYGQGLSVRAGAALALPFQDNYVFGLGANYTYKTDYKPVEVDSLGDYNPGNEINIFTGLDAMIGENSTVKLDVIYSIYSLDEYNGEKIFGSGNKLLFIASLNTAISEKPLQATLRFRQKGKNEFWSPLRETPDLYQKNGNQIEFVGFAQVWAENPYHLNALWDLRFYSKNENKLRDASIYGLGAGWGYALSEAMQLQVQAKYMMGKFEVQDVSGIDLYVGMQYQF